MPTTVIAEIPSRERVEFEFEMDSRGVLTHGKLRGVGGPEMLELLAEWRPRLKGRLADLPLPPGAGPGAMLIREVLLKAQGKWEYPYPHEELCHCRAVKTETVDAAILVGAHHPRDVSRMTSASTACGTCRPDIEAILEFRLGGRSKN